MSRKVTKEIFEKRLYDKFGDDVKLAGEFNGIKGKTTFKSDVCGHEWEQVAEVVLRNKSKKCLKCNGRERVTPEIFKERVYAAVGDEYTVMEDYVQNKVPVLMRHNNQECDYYTWKVFSDNFLGKGSRCPACSKKENGERNIATKRKTHDQFLKDLSNVWGEEYTPLTEYVNCKTHIKMKHESELCGYHEWMVTPSNILRKFGCPACKGRKISKSAMASHADFLDKVFKVHGDKYEILGKYEGNKKHIKVLHKECGYEYLTPPSVISKGHGCPKCAGIIKKTTESYSKEINVRTSGEFVLVSEYVNAHTYVTIKHDTEECGGTFQNTPNKLTYSINCPHCSMWGGEQVIVGFLKKYNLNYSPQYRFEDCRNVYPLPFDFALFNEDNSLNCLIEFDGLQHEQPVEWFGGEEKYEIQKMRDSIKNEYCEKNKIKLIRIPYREFKNIHLILEKELKDLL